MDADRLEEFLMDETRVFRWIRNVAIAGFILGALLLVGPGETIHHELHKRAIWFFRPCCCANATHTGFCGWSEHFGHAWHAHHWISVPALGLALLSLTGIAVTTLVIRVHSDAGGAYPVVDLEEGTEVAPPSPNSPAE